MQIIYGGRGTGKTTKLIQMVKKFGGILVVLSRGQKEHIVNSGLLAKDQVITFQESKQLRHCRGWGDPQMRYWIDQVDMLIEEMFGRGCQGFSMDTPDAITGCTQ